MPPAPSPRANKKMMQSSSSKTKGAVRAKSGCYTCRIRRKKCDEKRMGEDGPCETCYRLKLECLGFGAKRPDWLRESSRVSAIRDKIKNHLASQGMIKGHSGSGSRSAVHLDTLRLSDYRDVDGGPYGDGSVSDSSGSPHPRDPSPDSDPYPFPTMSFSGNMSSWHGAQSGYHLPPYDPHPRRAVSPSESENNTTDDYYENLAVVPQNQPPPTPAQQSSFSKYYTVDFADLLYTFEDQPSDIQFALTYNPSMPLTPDLIDDSMKYYVTNIVKIQYLLGDGNRLPIMVYNTVTSHDISRAAVKLLSYTYNARHNQTSNARVLDDESLSPQLVSIRDRLSQKEKGRVLKEDDAMAALHVVSLFLFDGGCGDWATYLVFATHYVIQFLTTRARDYYNDFAQAMAQATDKEQFVIKTTIWFDVLASITTQREPVLMNIIDGLFHPSPSGIFAPRPYTMMEPMGCENHVVWAMARASQLAQWKRNHVRLGDLSVNELVQRATEIETWLHPDSTPIPAYSSAGLAQPTEADPMDAPRRHSSELFRSATKLFIQSIVSDNLPHVKEIKRCVDEIARTLASIQTSTACSSIVRSTVFPLFICGALTDDLLHRRQVLLALERGIVSEGVGNTRTISTLLQEIWNTDRKRSDPVRWRQVLKNYKVLLV